MARKVKNGQYIYHLTSLDNIESIIRKGLLPRNRLNEFTDVADPKIISVREQLGLNDYVPFHFFVKNPFDYSVLHNHPEEQMVYLCLKRSTARSLGFKIIKSHPLHIRDDFEIYDYDVGFEELDWDLIEKADFLNDYECKQACMAECLFKGPLDVEYLDMIAVKNKEMQTYVLDILDKYDLSGIIKVYINPTWFLNKV